MDGSNQLGEFLRARRELAQPGDFGLPEPTRRRVPGLRREEVALLAGMSADYYIRLEQGRDKHPSEQVLDALARVFRLDADAVAHLHELARPTARRRRTPRAPERVSPSLRRLVDGWPNQPAVVVGRRMDVLVGNALAAVLCPWFVPGHNLVRDFFLDPESPNIYADWDAIAADSVASLRGMAGTDVDDPQLTDLVGELSLKSEAFRRLWARHDVRVKTAGSKRFRHPMVGELSLDYETLTVNGASGQMLIVYHAEPGSPSANALALLGSMAADAHPTATSRRSSDTNSST
ncbi:helix-turn-helix transcriptional regulator [Micromonospora deserti]|uniref:Transcriptional regulator n=1 Tax=Micromonospora deserti TaxID=2070366 RepID=A0A2W2CEE8_9ACTN|nr:helix-turn-helix transcriptional regulator [Micromonospora deserti]PZF91254.1 transcriptional regulator [Micromonospora deserti]